MQHRERPVRLDVGHLLVGMEGSREQTITNILPEEVDKNVSKASGEKECAQLPWTWDFLMCKLSAPICDKTFFTAINDTA